MRLIAPIYHGQRKVRWCQQYAMALPICTHLRHRSVNIIHWDGLPQFLLLFVLPAFFFHDICDPLTKLMSVQWQLATCFCSEVVSMRAYPSFLASSRYWGCGSFSVTPDVSQTTCICSSRFDTNQVSRLGTVHHL